MGVLYLKKEAGGVGYYKDAQCKQRLCLNPWPSALSPRFKYVMYNCQRYRVEGV